MRDAEVFYKQRDAEIKTIVNRLEIVTKSFGGHTLYEPEGNDHLLVSTKL